MYLGLDPQYKPQGDANVAVTAFVQSPFPLEGHPLYVTLVRYSGLLGTCGRIGYRYIYMFRLKNTRRRWCIC